MRDDSIQSQGPHRLQLNTRIGPRHPKLAAAGFRAARWLATKTMGAAGFHQLGSDFAVARIARVREKLAAGETVYLAGLGAPGTHNSGVALVEVTQANGPRLIVNNEEERFSGNKHTTEYPRASIDAMVTTLRQIGRNVGGRRAARVAVNLGVRHDVGLPGSDRDHGPIGARGSARQLQTSHA